MVLKEAVKRNYADIKEYIDFSTRLNGSINPGVVKDPLIDVYGGCEAGMNPLKVFKYFLGKKFVTGKGKTVNGIVCKESLKKKNDMLCNGCEFFDEDSERAPIYKFKEKV